MLMSAEGERGCVSAPRASGGCYPPGSTTGGLTPPARHTTYRGVHTPRSPYYLPGGSHPPLALGVSSGLRGLFLKQPDHFRFDALVINLLTDQFLDPAVLPIENKDTGNAADL
jgi:hypothetical protein